MSRDPLSDFQTGQWEKLKTLYEQALDLESQDRDRLLESEGADSETREQILRLLAYHQDAASYFSRLSDEIRSLAVTDPLLSPGEKLGDRFVVSRFLAQGGMGEVYEAEDLELGGRVALKVMRPGIAAHAGSLERFRREILLARKVNSPHVCRVHDVARHLGGGQDLIFFTMELLDGETLSDRLAREGSLAIDTAAEILRQMAAGLAAAHKVGVLHRDFKSSNVMLCPDGGRTRVVITDFGLARQLGGSDKQSDLADGATPAYVAPEQLESREDTQQTDIYSLGVVLFEMTTGTLPFRGESIVDTARMRLNVDPPNPRNLRPDLPRAWETTILRCLERDPARRFRQVDDVPAGIGTRGSPSTLRRVVLVSAAVAVLVLLAAFATHYLNPAPTGRRAPSLAILNLQASAGEEFLAEGLADRISDELTEIPRLRVLTRRMTRRLSTGTQTVPGLPPDSQPTHFLSGTLSKQGDHYRIALQMAAFGTGVQVWSATRDVTRAELEGAGRLFALGIVRSLEIPLLPAQISRVERPLTANGTAYENYLLGLGRYYFVRRDPEYLDESVRHLQAAVAADPAFAAAHAALATSLAFRASVNGIYRPDEVAASNREASRALDLDPTLPEAHVVLGINAQSWDWDWKLAEEHFRRAINIKPQLAQPHYGYARMLYPLGRLTEALAEIDKALQLDPLDRSAQVIRGVILMDMGRTDEAIAQQRSVTSADPALSTAYIQLSCSYTAKRMLAEAEEAARHAVELTHQESYALAQLGHVYALGGRRPEAEAILAELERRFDTGHAAPSEVAAIYGGWYDLDKTFEWLARGLAARDVELTALKVDPQFSFLRGDQRYQRLVAQLHLE